MAEDFWQQLMDLWNILPTEFIVVGIILIITLIIGFAVERFLYPQLRKGATRRRRSNPRILLRTLRGETLLWFILASAYVIIRSELLPISDQFKVQSIRLLQVLLILSVAWFVLQLSLSFIEYYTRKGTLPKTSIFNNLTKIIIITLAGVAILGTYNISVSPILAALGVGGLAIALALQDTLANLFAGISILSARQINPGDYVQLSSGEEGYVEDVNWKNTTIIDLNNATIIIPNKNLGNLIVTNYSLPITELNLRIPLGVSYDSDLNRVEEVTKEVAREILRDVDGGVENVEPNIRFSEFGDFAIKFKVVLRIRSFRDLRIIRSEFIKKIHTRFIQEDITIPFPIRTVYLKENFKEDIEIVPSTNNNKIDNY